MAAKTTSKKDMLSETGMLYVVTFVVLWAVNSIIIHFANAWFPQFLELGTANHSYLSAVLVSMGVLAVIDTFAIPFVHMYESKKGKMATPTEWMLVYFLVNTAAIWLIGRGAILTGLGISSWIVAVVLGLVLDIVQGFAMMGVEKMRK